MLPALTKSTPNVRPWHRENARSTLKSRTTTAIAGWTWTTTVNLRCCCLESHPLRSFKFRAHRPTPNWTPRQRLRSAGRRLSLPSSHMLHNNNSSSSGSNNNNNSSSSGMSGACDYMYKGVTSCLASPCLTRLLSASTLCPPAVVVVCESGVGKSELCSVLAQRAVPTSTASTIGIDLSSCDLLINNGATTVRVQLWDTAGQERYRSVTSVSVSKFLPDSLTCASWCFCSCHFRSFPPVRPTLAYTLILSELQQILQIRDRRAAGVRHDGCAQLRPTRPLASRN
eukprot:m.675951 g.675951  ORF g.675951 m.675951 type:complete len:284 (+) comp58555_c0_seq10:4861-5712(+)